MNQLLACLRLYSTGGHLQQVADFMGMHISTACRIVKRVSEAIARLYGQ
jgi:DNA-binding MarR family transcriptional regulator